MAFKGCAKLHTIANLWNDLKENAKLYIDNTISSNGPGSCLLRLLKLGQEQTDVPTSLCDHLMGNYMVTDQRLDFYSFSINELIMNVTLEDVLFLTQLPIGGKPVFSANSRDEDGFFRLFGISENTLSLVKLREIACGGSTLKAQIQAVLLIIVTCVIAPSGNGHVCRLTYVRFIEVLEEVNDYAWGAALLSFLYHGMKQYSNGKKKSVDGNIWVLLGFFAFHIPKLRQELNIELNNEDPHTPLLVSVVKGFRKIGGDHYATYKNKTIQILDNLQDTDMDWHPYNTEMLPSHFHYQIPLRTLLSPLFCFNFVEYHLPHVIPRQFEVLEGVNLDGVGSDLAPIKFKHNRGALGPNLAKHYKEELFIWDRKQLTERCNTNTPTPSASQISSNPDQNIEEEVNMFEERPTRQHSEEPPNEEPRQPSEEQPNEESRQPIKEPRQPIEDMVAEQPVAWLTDW